MQARGARTYLREKKLGIWRSWTWQQCGEVVCEMAQGLQALGLPMHGVVGILANTLFKLASAGQWHGIVGYNDQPLVSIDFNQRSESAILDATETHLHPPINSFF